MGNQLFFLYLSNPHGHYRHSYHHPYMILYEQDLPGQVESIIHQLSSVDHWNSLEKEEQYHCYYY